MREPMRIVYIADIHGAFDRVEHILDATDADVYIVSGDLIDLPFYTMRTAMHYHDLQIYFHSLRRSMDKTHELLEDFVDRLLLAPDTPDDIQEKGARFQQYTVRARRVMQQKYKVLENILSLKSGALCLCLPGNYDMDLKYTSLHQRDLHLQHRQAGELTVGGYGGAGGWTQGIPEKYMIRNRQGRPSLDRDREMVIFFESIRPDIIVTHQPAYGFHDQVAPMGETGSAALLNYCQKHDVAACLTGHIHEQWGLGESEGTIYLNPSNFGDVRQVSGRISEGGFFHEIEISNRKIRQVRYKKIVGGVIHGIIDYERLDGVWVSRIIDRERYGAHLRGQTYDRPLDSCTNAEKPNWHDNVDAVYCRRCYIDTDKTLRSIQEKLDVTHQNVNLPFALDIIGSGGDESNDGKPNADIVIYLYCGKSDDEKTCFGGAATDCPHFMAAQAELRKIIDGRFECEIVDCIDLRHVENSIRILNYDCEMAQRFVVFRSIGQPVGASLFAYAEALMSRNNEFRQELEGSIHSYFRIFTKTAGHARSFGTYEAHLHDVGIRLPNALRSRIRAYLERLHA